MFGNYAKDWRQIGHDFSQLYMKDKQIFFVDVYGCVCNNNKSKVPLAILHNTMCFGAFGKVWKTSNTFRLFFVVFKGIEIHSLFLFYGFLQFFMSFINCYLAILLTYQPCRKNTVMMSLLV